MSKKEFYCIDAHTCGNPVRLVAAGGPFLPGANMSEKRQYFLKEYDWVRRGLMFEPRGHDMMSGCFLYSPHDPQNDVAILFIAIGGRVNQPLHEMFFGLIGVLTDKYGKNWLLELNKPE